MGRLSPPTFRDTLLTTAPWALALGFALGAHAGWFCPGHRHATQTERAGDLDALDDDDPCSKARRERDARRLRELARDVHRVAETHEIPAELFATLVDDPWLLADHARAELVRRDGRPVGFKVSGTSRGGLVRALGLRDGDVIKALSGKPIRSSDDVIAVASTLRGASQVRMTIERKGVEIRKRYVIR